MTSAPVPPSRRSGPGPPSNRSSPGPAAGGSFPSPAGEHIFPPPRLYHRSGVDRDLRTIVLVTEEDGQLSNAGRRAPRGVRVGAPAPPAGLDLGARILEHEDSVGEGDGEPVGLSRGGAVVQRMVAKGDARGGRQGRARSGGNEGRDHHHRKGHPTERFHETRTSPARVFAWG